MGKILRGPSMIFYTDTRKRVGGLHLPGREPSPRGLHLPGREPSPRGPGG